MFILLLLILVVLAAGFGFISRSFVDTLKVAVWGGLWAIAMFWLWIFALGFHDAFAVTAATVVSAFSGGLVAMFVRTSVIMGRARRHPEQYAIADKSCGTCHQLIVKDPLGSDKAPYLHLHQPAVEHELVVVDEPPTHLPESMRRAQA